METRKADSKGRIVIGAERAGTVWNVHWQPDGSILLVPANQTTILREPAGHNMPLTKMRPMFAPTH